MNTTRPLIAAMLLVASAGKLSGQAAEPDSIRRRNDCRLAAQVIATGHPAPHHDWAISYIRYCSPDVQAPALRAGIARAAGSGDVATFRQLAITAIYVPNDGLLDQILSVATNGSNDENLRMTALLVLARLRFPEAAWEAADFSEPSADCVSRSRSDPVEVTAYRPQPVEFFQRLDAARAAIAGDSSQPRALRHLATCMG